MSKPTILVVQDYYLPAYKGGGSLRTVANIVDRLGNDFVLDVLCRDRDQDDTEPFPDLPGGWVTQPKCRVRYLPPDQITPEGLRRAASESDYSLIYFNSFFSKFTVYLLWERLRGRLPKRPVLLAPRGELAANALALKGFKKQLFIRLAQLIGLYKGIVWHASSEAEAGEVRRYFDGTTEICADLPAGPPDPSRIPPPPPKAPGAVRFVFLSRLARKKNLSRALDLLSDAKGEIVFDIYGTAEDPEYLEECKAKMAQLPPNVSCNYCGPIPYEQVHETFAKYHAFLFPTLNENFGHVILEAFLARIPAILSDQTFWRDLEQRDAGVDLPLEDDAGFRDAIRRFVEMDQETFSRLSDGALQMAHDYLNDPEPVDTNRALFLKCIERG